MRACSCARSAHLTLSRADPLVRRCVDLWEVHHAKAGPAARALALARRAAAALVPGSSFATSDVVFLPTTCLALLDTLAAARPAHRLIAADFDALPGVSIAGANAPLVASQRGGGTTTDHATYLVPRGEADIFFPTDFEFLRIMEADVRTRSGARAESLRTADFLLRALAPGEEWRRCTVASGFNPLLSEFPNTRVFDSG